VVFGYRRMIMTRYARATTLSIELRRVLVKPRLAVGAAEIDRLAVQF
jgi:hypothetical protein